MILLPLFLNWLGDCELPIKKRGFSHGRFRPCGGFGRKRVSTPFWVLFRFSSPCSLFFFFTLWWMIDVWGFLRWRTLKLCMEWGVWLGFKVPNFESLLEIGCWMKICCRWGFKWEDLHGNRAWRRKEEIFFLNNPKKGCSAPGWGTPLLVLTVGLGYPFCVAEVPLLLFFFLALSCSWMLSLACCSRTYNVSKHTMCPI